MVKNWWLVPCCIILIGCVYAGVNVAVEFSYCDSLGNDEYTKSHQRCATITLADEPEEVETEEVENNDTEI